MTEQQPRARSTTAYKNKSASISRASTGLDEDDFEPGPITRHTGLSSRAATKISEGGHDITKIMPMAKHSGKSVVTFFNGLFQTIIAIATLGTSITFSFILSGNTQLADPKAYFSQAQVVIYLAVSWLLFLLALAFASLGSTLLTFFKAHWVRDWDGEHGRRSQIEVQLYAVAISASLGGLIIAAFVFLCLVVVAYCAPVGWIALAFVGIFGLIMLAAVLYQMPWPWRSRLLDEQEKSP